MILVYLQYSDIPAFYLRIAFAASNWNCGIESVVLKKMPKKLLALLQKGKSRPFVADVL